MEQLRRFSVRLNDAWAIRGGTAVFSCEVNPQYARDYVTVVGWTHGSAEVQPGKLQGPVVQSIVSLTSSLRGQLVKCFMTL